MTISVKQKQKDSNRTVTVYTISIGMHGLNYYFLLGFILYYILHVQPRPAALRVFGYIVDTPTYLLRP